MPYRNPPVRCVLEDGFERTHGFTTWRAMVALASGVAKSPLEQGMLARCPASRLAGQSQDQPGPVLEGPSRRTLVVDYAVASASPRTGPYDEWTCHTRDRFFPGHAACHGPGPRHRRIDHREP